MSADPFRFCFPWQELHWFDVAGTERGFYNYAVDVNRGIACVAWKDTKLVNLVSTAFPPTLDVVTRGHKTADGYMYHNFAAPTATPNYVAKMNATDKYDQMRLAEFFSVERRFSGNKWWHKVHWGVWDCAMTNASICWCSVDEKRTRMDFIKELHQAYVYNSLDEVPHWRYSENARLTPMQSRSMREAPIPIAIKHTALFGHDPVITAEKEGGAKPSDPTVGSA